MSISMAGMFNKTRTCRSVMLQELSNLSFAAILRWTRMQTVFNFLRDQRDTADQACVP